MTGHHENCICFECEAKNTEHWGDGTLFDPVPRFNKINDGICPDCDGSLNIATGGCDDCHIVPSLDPAFQMWVKNPFKLKCRGK